MGIYRKVRSVSFALCALAILFNSGIATAAVDLSRLTLGSATNLSVFAWGSIVQDQLSQSNPGTTIHGDVGLGSNAVQNFASGDAFHIYGTYYVDPNADNSHAYNSANFTGGTVTQSLAYVVAAVTNLSSYAASLTATLTLSTTLQTNYTVVGNGGVNVISLPGINYSGPQVLTLQGGPNDIFIFNVTGQQNGDLTFTHANSTAMALNGVATNHVLFNLLDHNAGDKALNVSGDVHLIGTFLAPSASIDLAPAIIDGAVFAGGQDLTLSSGPDINGNDFFVIPEPSSWALSGLGLCWVAVAARRRRPA
jgi:hypothetical protein